MPIYEYRCDKCQLDFEKLVFGQDEVVCPTCGCQVQKLMSACSFKSAAGDFKTSGTGKSGCSTCSATSCAGCH
ncbi:MAG: zinc ribbon domain-containing protein [Desulfomonile tiedjei]|nr:zinc ribbon domain-containing protein [Desulfomonile tiedjei]